MATWFLINLTLNTFTTLWFCIDTDVQSFAGIVMMALCCILPIIPIGYAYRWCNKFVRGEI